MPAEGLESVAEIIRRLAAVAFADVAGWSRLIEKNDIETLEAWKALRGGLIEPKIDEFKGRLLEMAGDAVLVEFPSAVAAVGWAIDVQEGIRTDTRSRRLSLRIGINVEDVIVDGDKLVGSGVNVASRIQQLAEPGDIVVTAAVHDYVLNKLPVAFADLGTRELKNISRAVQLYRVLGQGGTPADRATASEAIVLAEQAGASMRALLDITVADQPKNGHAAFRWNALLERVEAGVLTSHGGRLLAALDRRMVAAFPAVPSAVKAAFEIQRFCSSANAGLPEDRQMTLRMGLQVGEALAGEQASLATRLSTIAGPGEIVVSPGVRDLLTPMLDADIEDLGDCYLRELAHPVRAYRIGPPGPRPVVPRSGAPEDMRPTIAVIPFAPRSSDPEHYLLGEILADEIISELSHTADMNVISRLSTTAFRGRETSLEEMSGHLNANYILSGAYRVTGGQYNLIAELAETKAGRIVAVKDSRGNARDLLTGDDETVGDLVAEVATAINMRELQRAQTQALPTLEGYTLLIGAISLIHRLSRHDFDRAQEMLKALIDRAPRHAVPHAWLAKWHVMRVWQGWSADLTAEASLALECTQRALDADPHCSLALVIDGLVHMNLLKRLDVADERYRMALQVNPNDSLGWLLKGTLHAFKGEGKEAVQFTRRARRLSPLDPLRYYYDSLSATAAMSAGKYERAIELAHRSLRANRTHTSTLRAMAIAQWQLGREADARKTVAELMQLEPDLTIRNYLERSPISAFETGAVWSNALLKAGVPR